jgi:hypothetical protein
VQWALLSLGIAILMYAWGVLIETMTSLINCGAKNAQAGSGERKEEGIEAVSADASGGPEHESRRM